MSLREYKPPTPLKSGIPDNVEIPAPVSTATCLEFLIISNTIAPGTLMVLNDELKDELRALKYGDYHPAFKMATQHIVEEDLKLYPDLDAILKHLKRKLETDLVVEYLKGVES